MKKSNDNRLSYSHHYQQANTELKNKITYIFFLFNASEGTSKYINHYCIIAVSKTIILARIFLLWYLANAVVLYCKEEKESSGRKKISCGLKEDIIIPRGKKNYIWMEGKLCEHTQL